MQATVPEPGESGRQTSARRPGRPKGRGPAVDVVPVFVCLPRCPRCGSTRRSRYWGQRRFAAAGDLPDGTLYTTVTLRHCRCLDCGHLRIERRCS